MPVATDEENRGVAIAGYALGVGLFVALMRKGIISDTDGQRVIDEGLSALERRLPLDDGGAQIARQLMEQLGHLAGGPPTSAV